MKGPRRRQYAGMAEWLCTRFPPEISEFDSPSPLYAGAARRSSTWLPSTRRGSIPLTCSSESVRWRGDGSAKSVSRVQFPPDSLCSRPNGLGDRLLSGMVACSNHAESAKW